jgi:hypothetical protein
MKSRSRKKRVQAPTRKKDSRSHKTKAKPDRSPGTAQGPGLLVQANKTGELSEGEFRLRQLQDVEAALLSLKESNEKLTSLAKTQSDCIIGQWAHIQQLREIQAKALREQSFAAVYGRMWC